MWATWTSWRSNSSSSACSALRASRSCSSRSSCCATSSAASAERIVLELPTDLPADLAPLSWLLGVWEGTGVIDYPGRRRSPAGRVHASGELQPRRRSLPRTIRPPPTLAGDDGAVSIPLVAETGFWRLSRPATDADAGPGAAAAAATATVTRGVDDVEALRAASRRLPDRGVDRARRRDARALPRRDQPDRASTSPPTRSSAAPGPRSTAPRRACTDSSTTICCGRGTSPPSAPDALARLGAPGEGLT